MSCGGEHLLQICNLQDFYNFNLDKKHILT